jgi:UDP-N-acetylmuramyl pentapeptide synthase
MKLKDIIKGIDCKVDGDMELEVKDIQFDSRKVSQGTLFVAQRGTKVDGHDFIGKAVEQGAVAVVCEKVESGKWRVESLLVLYMQFVEVQVNTFHFPFSTFHFQSAWQS